MFLINGAESETLAVNDRGVQFGDGCFTTARILRGQVQLLSAHLARLQTTCEKLFIPYDDWALLAQEMARLAQPHQDGVLKVIITRGAGGRGYSAAGCVNPTRILSVSPRPAHYLRWREEGISLSLSPVRLGRNPSLAGLKHLNRLEQVLIRSHLEQTDADEALVLDSDGWLTECCAANVFGVKDPTSLPRASIRRGSTVLCASTFSLSWHHRRFALEKPPCVPRRYAKPMRSWSVTP